MRLWQKALHREEWHRWFAWHPAEAGDTLVWLTWIERRRCYAVIDEWWDLSPPDTEEERKIWVAHRRGPERREALAVCAENSYVRGEREGAAGKFKVPQAPLGQDRV